MKDVVNKILAWATRVTAMRIAITIALVFVLLDFFIESEFHEHGPLSKNGMIHMLDLKSLDLKFRNSPSSDLPDPQVVVAGIDEKGVERFGLWPWSRSVIAQFIQKTTEGGAKVIGFDAVFSDEDKNSSYMSVNRFLKDYDARELNPEAPRAQAIGSQQEAVSREISQAADLIAAADKRLKEGGAIRPDKRRPAVKAMAEARKAVEKAKRGLQRLTSDTAQWQTQSASFYENMKNEIAAVSPDDALAAAIAASPQTILGYFNFYTESEVVGISPEERKRDLAAIQPVAIGEIYERTWQDMGGQDIEIMRPVPNLDFDDLQIRDIIAAQAPLQKLADVAKGFGYFNVPPDEDGVMRRVRLLNKYKDKLYPALSLLSAARYFESDINPINGTIKPRQTLDGISLTSGTDIPTDLHGRLLVNYYTDPADYFPTYSVADFIDGTVPPEAYKDKVVLFGMTAQGLFDLRPTPFSATTPGVYIHATAVQNILDGRYVQRFYGMQLIEMLAYLLLGILMGWFLPKLPAWGGLLATFGIALGIYVLDVYIVFPRGYWMLNVLPTIQAVLTFIGVSVYGYLTEGREKRQIRKAFQFYLTKSVVDEMLKDTSKLRLGGEKRTCTVLFSDIRGFTTISERLTPEALVHLLNEYLTPMTNIVFEYDGTLDKYMGDAVMAIFGAPIAHRDHAYRGCCVALDMMTELAKLQEGWREQGLPELDIGIGLNTGAMSVGNMGSEVRFDYTVMGDNVNLGSRLEGINKTYGTNIIISEYTRAAAADSISAREMDSVRVKGKREPVVIYELLDRGKPKGETAQLITTFEDGIAQYKAQRWDEAIALFDSIRTDIKLNDFASNMYIQRCEAMRAQPPGEDWDGVFTMTTK